MLIYKHRAICGTKPVMAYNEFNQDIHGSKFLSLSVKPIGVAKVLCTVPIAANCVVS